MDTIIKDRTSTPLSSKLAKTKKTLPSWLLEMTEYVFVFKNLLFYFFYKQRLLLIIFFISEMIKN